MKRSLLLMMILLASSLYGEIRFSDLDINEEKSFLFSLDQTIPFSGEVKTLFLGEGKSRSFAPLTFFPEKSWFNNSSGKAYIQNRLGLFTNGPAMNSFRPVEDFPSFSDGGYTYGGKILPLIPSPDGKQLLYLKPLSDLKGRIGVFSLEEGTIRETGVEVELTYDNPYALWSPDSAHFIYSRDGRIYYYSLLQLDEQRVVEEDLRFLGEGKLSSVSWNKEEDHSILYMASDRIIQRIDSSDMFTRSLYNGEFNSSRVAGRFPFKFDPNFDRLVISPDGQRALLVKNGTDLLIYNMNKTDYQASGKRVRSLPCLQLPKSMSVKQLIWARSGKLAVLAESRSSGQSMVFTHDPGSAAPLEFIQSVDRGIVSLAINRSETRLALAGAEGVTIRSFDQWNVLAYRVHMKPLALHWTDDNHLLVNGDENTSLYDFKDDTVTLAAFSRYDRSGFTKDGRVLIQQNDKKYLYNDFDSTWTETGRYTAFVDPVTHNSDYRINLETTPASVYSNRIMVKEDQALQSEPLFNVPQWSPDPFAGKEELQKGLVFNHGSRVRSRQIALVFNILDSVEGLAEALDTLHDYGIKATFFVNGEFIRRHPDAAKELALSGHEVGSMFFSSFDMTDNRFTVDEDFIIRGLSFNEDEYFSATGKELEPLWHPPWYSDNDMMIGAARKKGYTYVGRDIEPLDWIGTEGGLGSVYLSSDQIIEKIMDEKQPGSIVPVTIGKTAVREDYLFMKLDLLIEALMRKGYDLVTVSELIGNWK